MLPVLFCVSFRAACIALTAPIPALYHLFVLPTIAFTARRARPRGRFLSILEHARERYRFVVVGYVGVLEHIHLLVTEPEVGTPSTVNRSRVAANSPDSRPSQSARRTGHPRCW